MVKHGGDVDVEVRVWHEIMYLESLHCDEPDPHMWNGHIG